MGASNNTRRPARRQPEQAYLTISDAAAYLGISAKTVSRWIQTYRDSQGRRGLPAYAPGRKILIRKTELETFVKSQKLE